MSAPQNDQPGQFVCVDHLTEECSIQLDCSLQPNVDLVKNYLESHSNLSSSKVSIHLFHLIFILFTLYVKMEETTEPTLSFIASARSRSRESSGVISMSHFPLKHHWKVSRLTSGVCAKEEVNPSRKLDTLALCFPYLAALSDLSSSTTK